MVVSKYEEINGKTYVDSKTYDEVLYSLKNANDIIKSLEDKLHKYEIENTNLIGMTPIEVANMLITHTTHLEKYLCMPERNINTFNVDELEQIAEYLLVYCKHYHNRDD